MKAFLALALVSLPIAALADESSRPPTGSLIVTGDFALSVQSLSSSTSGSDGSLTWIRIAPSLDYVVGPGITIGGGLSYTHVDLGSDVIKPTNQFGVVARGGYIAAIGEKFSLWPRLGLSYERGFEDFPGLSILASDDTERLSIKLDATLLYTPVPHFFIGLGPTFSADVLSKNDGKDNDKILAFGAATMIGGWF